MPLLSIYDHFINEQVNDGGNSFSCIRRVGTVVETLLDRFVGSGHHRHIIVWLLGRQIYTEEFDETYETLENIEEGERYRFTNCTGIHFFYKIIRNAVSLNLFLIPCKNIFLILNQE